MAPYAPVADVGCACEKSALTDNYEARFDELVKTTPEKPE